MKPTAAWQSVRVRHFVKIKLLGVLISTTVEGEISTAVKTLAGLAEIRDDIFHKR